MVERGWGRVVNIGSDAGRVGSSLESVYSGAKGGVIAFTKTIAREVARVGRDRERRLPGPDAARRCSSGWRARAASGSSTSLTRAVPMRRLGEPEDVAAAVAFLASDARRLHHRPDALGQRRPDDGLSCRSGPFPFVVRVKPTTRRSPMKYFLALIPDSFAVEERPPEEMQQAMKAWDDYTQRSSRRASISEARASSAPRPPRP